MIPLQTTSSSMDMAWVVLVLRELDDTPERFPHGKWGTIQAIESQLQQAAQSAAKWLPKGAPTP